MNRCVYILTYIINRLLKISSRLYSEKAYVLSRNFVRRTLETPFGGFELEIHWLYYSRRLLEKVLRDSRALIKASSQQLSEGEMEKQTEQYVIPLSTGGIIALERVLTALQNLLDVHSNSAL